MAVYEDYLNKMPGGEIQLAAIGAQDLYLTSNPQISFFKAVYKQYTNFAQQLIELDDDSSSNNLSSFNETIKLKYKIPRNADLLKEIYIQLRLPAIYSNDNLQFQWIRRLGEYMVREIRIIGGDSNVYNRIRGEYLHIYNELNIPASKKGQYNRQIGNIPELYDPANVVSNQGLYPSKSKPSSGSSNGIPSIPSVNLIIPIPFWFCNYSGSTIPLIALQKMDFRIEVDIRPLNELYTIIDTNPQNTTFLTRIRPILSSHYFNIFTNDSTDSTLSNFNVSLYGNYIFLDRGERKRFAQVEHRYLMKQVQYNENVINMGSGGNYITVCKWTFEFPSGH